MVTAALAVFVWPLFGDDHPELVAPPQARNVQRAAQEGAAGVSFEITVPYPATEFLGKLKAELSALGWHALEMSWTNPTIPSSMKRGWQSFVDAREPNRKFVHQWMTDWKDAKGNILSYALVYDSPAPSNFDELGPIPNPTGSKLRVVAQFVPASIATRMHEWALAHPPVIKTEAVPPQRGLAPKHPSGDLTGALFIGVSDLRRTSRRMSDGTLMDGVGYMLHLKNKSDAEISRVNYEIVFKNRNGKPLSTMKVDDNAPLGAGVESIQRGWAPFDCDASGVKGVDLRVEQGITRVRFADGTNVTMPARPLN